MHLDVEQALERLLLRGRELVVGDEQVEARLALGREQLLGLALADVPVGIDVAAVLPLGADDVRAGRHGEAGELAERVFGGPAGIVAGVDGEQECALGGRRDFDHGTGAHALAVYVQPPRATRLGRLQAGARTIAR